MDPQYAKRLGGSKRPQEDPRDPSSSPAAPTSAPCPADAVRLGSSPKRRFRSSSQSPQKKEAYADRYIPCRNAGAAAFYGHPSPEGMTHPPAAGHGMSHAAAAAAGPDAREEPGKVTYNLLLRNELLGAGVDDMKTHFAENEKRPPGGGGGAAVKSPPRNVLKYKLAVGKSSAVGGGLFEPQSPYSLTPVGADSQKLLLSPRKAPRKIAKVPFKVLDAPDLQDDFYLNLVDWSSQNVLCVGLGSCVYLWSACTSQVTKLCDLRSEGEDDLVTSVKWMQRGSHLAVGTNKGFVQIWDAQKCTNVRTLEGHSGRVGALAWNGNTLSSGSRDRKILQRDIRATETAYAELLAHKQEVCGLEWSPDDQHLASGGNDNKLFIWNAGYTQPRHRFNEHIAAVKAIAWSPHQHGLLASGGGTADQCIRFWNTLTSTPLQCVETKSQVCNLAWSKNANELVSTHGYSQNQIILWKYPSMTQIATLTGHTYRVLYLAMSPDGQTIVTGAGDETLRFWNVFSKSRSPKQTNSVLNMFTHIR